jgi:hypothetical protein
VGRHAVGPGGLGRLLPGVALVDIGQLDALAGGRPPARPGPIAPAAPDPPRWRARLTCSASRWLSASTVARTLEPLRRFAPPWPARAPLSGVRALRGPRAQHHRARVRRMAAGLVVDRVPGREVAGQQGEVGHDERPFLLGAISRVALLLIC